MKTRAKIAFIELVRPDTWWPQPYTIEQTFEVFRWMASTGREYERPTRWGRNGPLETLSCAPSCTGHDHVTPIRSLPDLRQRFHFGVLSNHTTSSGVDEWREAEKIYIGSERILTFRHHKPFTGGGPWSCEAEVQKALEKLFLDGRTLRTGGSLNSVHKTAQTCKKIEIAVYETGFRFFLTYGWPDEESSSCWTHNLARTEGNEPFLCTMARAETALRELTDG